ncbi:MAG TPA: winged helix-turn-helix transcriptional regulator, partial [Pseudomonas sp.]|nr:winged helix-turn-helix transcriptional regulator [Pseudomonas sp.]
MNLDSTDLRILHQLQQDGRISNQELAEKVALSPSACLRRLRLLESEGI